MAGTQTIEAVDEATVQAEIEFDPESLLAEPPPEPERERSRFDYLELQEKGFDKGAIQLLAAVGLVKDDEIAEGKVVEKKPPWWIVPETPEHVQNILRIIEIREKEKADKVTQHARELRKMNKRLEFYEKIVKPQCVEIVDKLLPRDATGVPRCQYIEHDLKRLQLRTQSETVKLQDPEAVIKQMEAWERDLADAEARLEKAETDEERMPLVDLIAQLEPDLAELSQAFRLSIVTKEEFEGEEIANEFETLPRAEGAMPYRVTVLTKEHYLGDAGWDVFGVAPEPAPGEEYEKTVESSAVEAFVTAHPPIQIIDAHGEVLEEYPFGMPGVARLPAKTSVFCG